MKKLFMIIAAAFAFVACDEDGNLDTSKLDGLVIDAKWVFEDGDYTSFEFNEYGNYIVVCNDGDTGIKSSASLTRAESDDSDGSSSEYSDDDYVSSGTVIVGDYESDGDTAINMIGFGRLELTSAGTDSATFSLTLEDESEAVVYTVSIAEVIASSDNTSLLCRKWDLVGYTEDGVTDILSDDDAKTVLFSKAGTYLIEWSDGTSSLAQWKWKSESDKTFYYTWTGEWDDDYVTITTLTSSKAVIYEDYGGTDGYGITTLTPSN